MLRSVSLLILLLLPWGPTGGRLLQLSGRGFSFSVLEPEGWKLATRSAPQIATFIFEPIGVDWRHAESVVFVRFVPREPTEAVDEFSRRNRSRFLEECPFADSADFQSPFEAVDGFATEAYRCPGVRDEVVAVRAVPGFFIVFVLSSRNPAVSAQNAAVLRQILTSFVWRETPVPSDQEADPPPASGRWR